MKSNFKYIVVAIIGSLSIVFIIQLFWLKGLYNTIDLETQKKIMECIDIANSYELEYRLDSMERSPQENRYRGEMSITQSVGDDKEDSDEKRMVKKKRILQGGDTIQDTQEDIGDGEFSLAQFEKLGILVREAIHQAIDSVAPIRLDTLHSSLLSELTEKGVRSKIYLIEVVDFRKDTTFQKLSLIQTDTNPFVLNYKYDSANDLGYRILLEPLTRTVLNQMLGILSTTLVLILILCVAFWYLIRTIFEQKTLDEMKDDFTNNMTHELKTPIAVAYSATDALLNFGQGEDKEKRERYLTVCKEQLEKLTDLVEHILSMSMERRLKFVLNKEPLSVKDLLESMAEQHRMKSDKEIVYSFNIEPTNLTVYADKTQLNNVISNLIDNAVKYSGNNVRISLRAYQESGLIIIEIEDNGIGIPVDKQKYLFDKFYRVPQGNKHNAKGAGIGLFYVKTIVEKHGGVVSVSSEEGRGSLFKIQIPIE